MICFISIYLIGSIGLVSWSSSDEEVLARKRDSAENNKNFANDADAHRKIIVDENVEDIRIMQMELPPHLFPLTIAPKSRAEESAVQPILAIPGTNRI
jgi:hypothetical protein